MKNIADVLKQQVGHIVQKLFHLPIDPVITWATQPQFGHYQCNDALKLAKQLQKNPREIAQLISCEWKSEIISKLEVAGAGFINIFIDRAFLTAQLNEMLTDSRLGIDLPLVQQKIVVEFSSPNIAKELHVGHLRSTIIGDCLARLFEFLGHDVLRLNHLGDWGTQFGMLIAYMRLEAADVLAGRESTDLQSLMMWYRESKKKFDADLTFKKEAQLQVTKLQGGDEATLAAWQMICEISRKAFQEIYTLLDIHLIERGESFYNCYLPKVVDHLEKMGMITISDGAKCIYLEGYEGRDGKPLPIIIQKSDGGYNYDTTEMAALWHRIEIEKCDRIIIVTDAGQSLHFEMIFQAAEKGGYLDSSRVRVDHVPFGVVLGPDGKKFKTRSGETEKLIDLLLEAVALAKQNLQGRVPEENLSHSAQVLGIDAIKYHDLASHRIKDYVFSYSRMLQFEGNTAAFLLYAYVRICSIQKKVGKKIEGRIEIEHPTEFDLALHLRRFGEALEAVADELLPHRLADYLYTLAEKFHAFFRDCRVEGSPQETSRFLLCELTARVLRQGLDILGLKTLERM